jgi:hypothetical protein
MGLTEPRAVASSLPWKGTLRKAPWFHLHAVLASASLLLCMIPASALAQQQTAEVAVRRISLPGAPLARTPDTEGSASVGGTVLDVTGGTVPGAEVSLAHEDGTQLYTMISEANGEFNFTRIPAGSYLVMVNARGFAPFTSAELVVTAQQAYEVPDISLSVAIASIEVTVRPTDLIAAEQIKAEEKQRLIGVIPNFYTSYIYDAAPLTSKQKFSLAARGTFDPVSMIGVGFAAGSESSVPQTELSPTPQTPKRLDRRWPMPCIVVVGVGEYLQSALNELPEQPDPIREVFSPVSDCLIPHLHHFLDAVTITKPTNICKIGCNEIEIVFHLPRAQHP